LTSIDFLKKFEVAIPTKRSHLSLMSCTLVCLHSLTSIAISNPKTCHPCTGYSLPKRHKN
jgi:hypothetical protein